jgi:exodeoxyribonuclease VII large subunit
MDVDDLALMIKGKMNEISDLEVQGELTKITTSSSGHVYFDLLGKNSRVSCVVWASYNQTPEKGAAQVKIRNVDYYGPFGKCQAVVTSVVNVDEEAHIADKHSLVIKKLQEEGLLHRERLTIPEIINHLCIITSDGSAAYHDMIHGVESRWKNLRTTVIHSSVQGKSAVSDLKFAFDKAYALKPDVIICGRGGGSDADLEVFNEEEVVRCFVNNAIPVISAVGHETDTCICDLVSDVRAKTPTAAVEMCVPLYTRKENELLKLQKTVETQIVYKLESMYTQVKKLQSSMVSAMRSVLSRGEVKQFSMQREFANLQTHFFSTRQTKLSYLSFSLSTSVDAIYKRQTQRIEMLQQKKNVIYQNILHKSNTGLELLRCKLNASSIPQNIQNGFTIALKKRKVICSNSDIQENDKITLMFRDGETSVVVTSVIKSQ